MSESEKRQLANRAGVTMRAMHASNWMDAA
jgi:hypothetical protein